MSKVKQHLEDKIVIDGSTHEEMGWKRRIYFTYQNEEYEITLFWDEFNGYEMYWNTPGSSPDWVDNWNKEAHEGMSFEHYLDELTWERSK